MFCADLTKFRPSVANADHAENRPQSQTDLKANSKQDTHTAMQQDWSTVTLSKKPASAKVQTAAAARSGTLETEKRYAAGENKSAHAPAVNARKLEETEELRRE